MGSQVSQFKIHTLHLPSVWKMKVLLAPLCLAVLMAILPPGNPQPLDDSLLCTICVDILTDLDTWLTSDSTEGDIVDWVSQICHTLGQLVSPDLEATCNLVIGAQLPAIIDGLVEQNLDPQEVCQAIGACTE